MTSQPRDRVFVSYSHKDKEWLSMLRQVFAPDIRNDRLDYWDDRDLEPGDPWYDRILDAIAHARVAVLLVSPNFLASRFIMEEELPRILAAVTDGLTILWVPLSGAFRGEGAVEGAEVLDPYQAVCDTSRPLVAMDEEGRAAVLLDLCRRVNRILQPGRVPWNLPFPSLGELFKGRTADLARLETKLKRAGAAVIQPQAIIGMGGLGKTRLAVEYAWRHREQFGAFLFVSANTPDDLATNLSRLAAPDALDLPEYRFGTQADQHAAVVHWLQQSHDWLLIIDNVDTLEAAAAVQSLAGRLAGGQILITTRVTEWGGGVQELRLEVLPHAAAVALLLESAQGRRAVRPDDLPQAEALATRLGCLPLALTHASAYLANYAEGFSEYIARFDRDLAELLEFHSTGMMEYPREVAVTFFTSFDRLGPTAKAVLRAASVLAPELIPVAMFEKSPRQLQALVDLWCEESGERAAKPSVRDALADLARFSLVTRGDGTFSVHRIEQLVILSRVPGDREAAWVAATAELVAQYAPTNGHHPDNWATWDPLYPHAELVARRLEKWSASHRPPRRLLRGLDEYCFGKGWYEKSLAYARRTFELIEATEPEDSLDLAHQALGFGESLRVLGRHEEAEKLFRRSYDIYRKRCPDPSDDVATSMNYLGMAIEAGGDTDGAARMYREALEICARLPEPDGFARAALMHNLATIQAARGETAEAETLLRQSIGILERRYCANDQRMLEAISRLAAIQAAKGEDEEAEALYRRTWNGWREVYGPTNAVTLRFQATLAKLLDKRGKQEEALLLRHDMLQAAARASDAEQNPQLAMDLNNLSVELRQLHRLDEAETMLRQALAIDERCRGTTHAKIPHRLMNLCTVLVMQGNLAEAKSHLERGWRLKAAGHDLTSARLLFIRLVVAMLEKQPGEVLLGQLKSLAPLGALPDYSDVSKPWDIGYFVADLQARLAADEGALVAAIVLALNAADAGGSLEASAMWLAAVPVPLETAWPD